MTLYIESLPCSNNIAPLISTKRIVTNGANEELKSISIDKVMDTMGFPANYKNILRTDV